MCRAAGARLHTYGGGFRYNNDNTAHRFKFSIIPWVFDAQASYFWAHFWHNGEPFNPFEQAGFSTASLHTPHGPIPTTGLKVMRQSIDDRRYLMTLEKLIDAANSSGDAALRARAAEHDAFIQSFKVPLQKLGVRGGSPNFESNNAKTDSVGSVTVTNLAGDQFVLDENADTWAFCEFIRADVAKRIINLDALLNN
jgi:hypothetical protein